MASGLPAKIVEISAIGCKIEHKEKMSIGGSVSLRFKWHNRNIEVRAKLARTQLRSAFPEGMFYESGLKFADSLEEAPAEIRHVVASLAGEEMPPDLPPEIREPEESAPLPTMEPEAESSMEVTQQIEDEAEDLPTPDSPPPASDDRVAEEELEEFDYEVPDEFEDIDSDTLRRKPKYIECALDPMGQWHRRPVILPIQPEDGFITHPQDESELDMLCKTYAYADPDTRRLIRISLELAATRRV